MNLDPKISMWLNIAYAVLTGISGPMLQAAGIANAEHVIAWMAIAAVPLNIILHAYSAPTSGPMVTK